MTALVLFPSRVRFVNQDGTLTPEAYRALQEIVSRTGGTLGAVGTDTYGDIVGDTSNSELNVAYTDVVQPVEKSALLEMVTQPTAQEQLLPDVVQPPSEAKAFDLAAATHAATSKTTPLDADELPMADSASNFTLKKLTWENLKATLATWINANLIPAYFTSVTSSGDIKGPNVTLTSNVLAETNTNSNGTIAVNYWGYNKGATQFRDFEIYDGKNASVAKFTGSTKELTLRAGLVLASYTVATRPAHAAGKLIYVSDGGAGAVFQGSNGSAWVNLG